MYNFYLESSDLVKRGKDGIHIAEWELGVSYTFYIVYGLKCDLSMLLSTEELSSENQLALCREVVNSIPCMNGDFNSVLQTCSNWAGLLQSAKVFCDTKWPEKIKAKFHKTKARSVASNSGQNAR